MAEQEQSPRRITPLILVRLTFEKWYADNMPRHAAALAYYTIFAVAPLLVIVVAIAGLIYGREAARGQIAAQVDHYINSPPAAALIQDMLVSLNQSSSNVLVTILSVVALIYGASNVFGELQITLNHIWHAPRKNGNAFWGIVLQRLLAIGMVLVSGIVLFLSLVLSTWITAANQWAALRFALLPEYGEWSYFFLLLTVTTLVFALIYRFVPDVRKPWHDVIVGAVATALLFSLARLLLGWYLSYTSIASTYGAAGSLVLLLLWVYYSAQIFLLGAAFTQVYGELYSAATQRQSTAPQPGSAEPVASPGIEPVAVAIAAKLPIVDGAESVQEAAAPTPLPAVTPESALEAPIPQSRWQRLRARLLGRWHRPRIGAALQSPWTRVRALGRFLRSLGTIPLRLTRPLGEVALAAGVIGIASLAALLLGPLRRRAEPQEDEPA